MDQRENNISGKKRELTFPFSFFLNYLKITFLFHKIDIMGPKPKVGARMKPKAGNNRKDWTRSQNKITLVLRKKPTVGFSKV